MKKYPNTEIFTSGKYVGLPDGQMGNSEVGHTNIGAGRIVYQDLTKITKSIEDGDFFYKPRIYSSNRKTAKKHNFKIAYKWVFYQMVAYMDIFGHFIWITRNGKEKRLRKCICTLLLRWKGTLHLLQEKAILSNYKTR